MKMRQMLIAVAGLQIVICAGCGKKESAPPPDASSAPKQKSVAELVAPADNGAPAPPAPEAPTAPTTPNPGPETAAPEAKPGNNPNGGFAGALNQSQYQRNINWITRIGSGDPQEKTKALAEIKRANLSASELGALKEMGQYYGVKF